MMRLIYLAVIVAAAYQGWSHYLQMRGVEPLYPESYVAVYGRNSCGWTQKMLRDLKQSNVNYKYFSVDDKAEAQRLHSRMQQSGIDTKRYFLPVVDVNGHISVRPESEIVISDYQLP